jgi:uncharacterized protein (TIGR02646 family)
LEQRLIVIRIQKGDAPQVLLDAGKQQRKADCASYSRSPEAYRSGAKVFDFNAKIYAHPTVKEALITLQHHKCCFCENIISNDGDVEHFRPKRAFKQAKGTALKRPGYYWLAYEWANLFLACPSCNQRHKQNLFPLANPNERTTDHKSKVQEQPLFIDPSIDDPEQLIGFKGARAYAIDENQRAATTIKNLQLNRYNLSESRLKYLKPLKILHKLVQYAAENPDDVGLQQFAQEAQQTLNEAVQNNSPFTASVRAAQKNDFRNVPLDKLV